MIDQTTAFASQKYAGYQSGGPVSLSWLIAFYRFTLHEQGQNDWIREGTRKWEE